MIRKLIQIFKKKEAAAPEQAPLRPLVISVDEHKISKKSISHNAEKVARRLQQQGFEAYLVGGAVRDLLLGFEPKDFDIATNAKPDEVKHLFRNGRIIGRRFKLVHVHFGREIIEVATFRRSATQSDEEGHLKSDDGMILRDNLYGEIHDDALRRDFTANALYYDPVNGNVVDYVGGVNDLRHNILRSIGDPIRRFQEDPLRMLRAARFSAKLGLQPDDDTRAAFNIHRFNITQVPPARVFEEFKKLFLTGKGAKAFEIMIEDGLFEPLFPEAYECLIDSVKGKQVKALYFNALTNTDHRINTDSHINPAFLLAVFLWPAITKEVRQHRKQGQKRLQSLHFSADKLMKKQIQKIAIPRRFSVFMRDMWAIQFKFHLRLGRKAYHLLEQQHFRAAFDLLQLRAESGEPVQALAEWWSQFKGENLASQESMVSELFQQVKQNRLGNSSQNQND